MSSMSSKMYRADYYLPSIESLKRDRLRALALHSYSHHQHFENFTQFPYPNPKPYPTPMPNSCKQWNTYNGHTLAAPSHLNNGTVEEINGTGPPANTRSLSMSPNARYIATGYVGDELELLQRGEQVAFQSSEMGRSEGFQAPFYTQPIAKTPPPPERTLAVVEAELRAIFAREAQESAREKDQRDRANAIVIPDDDENSLPPPPRTPRHQEVIYPARVGLRSVQSGAQLLTPPLGAGNGFSYGSPTTRYGIVGKPTAPSAPLKKRKIEAPASADTAQKKSRPSLRPNPATPSPSPTELYYIRSQGVTPNPPQQPHFHQNVSSRAAGSMITQIPQIHSHHQFNAPIPSSMGNFNAAKPGPFFHPQQGFNGQLQGTPVPQYGMQTTRVRPMGAPYPPQQPYMRPNVFQGEPRVASNAQDQALADLFPELQSPNHQSASGEPYVASSQLFNGPMTLQKNVVPGQPVQRPMTLPQNCIRQQYDPHYQLGPQQYSLALQNQLQTQHQAQINAMSVQYDTNQWNMPNYPQQRMPVTQSFPEYQMDCPNEQEQARYNAWGQANAARQQIQSSHTQGWGP